MNSDSSAYDGTVETEFAKKQEKQPSSGSMPFDGCLGTGKINMLTLKQREQAFSLI